MSKYLSVSRMAGPLLFVVVFFGSGCAPKTPPMPTIQASPSANVVTGRGNKDNPLNCDIHSPAAPPCTYQVTPDGMLATYIEASPPASTSTAYVMVQRKDGAAVAVYSAPRSKENVWYTSGISDDGQFIYVIDYTLDFNNPPIDAHARLTKVDATNHTGKQIDLQGRWPLDVYVHKNLMILWNVDETTKKETLVLTDLTGKVLRVLYEQPWTDIDESKIVYVGDRSKAYSNAKDVVFIQAIISPDGTRALVQGGPTPWPANTLFDLETGNKTDLTPLPQNTSIKGWADNDALLLRDEAGATSTFMVNK